MAISIPRKEKTSDDEDSEPVEKLAKKHKKDKHKDKKSDKKRVKKA